MVGYVPVRPSAASQKKSFTRAPLKTTTFSFGNFSKKAVNETLGRIGSNSEKENSHKVQKSGGCIKEKARSNQQMIKKEANAQNNMYQQQRELSKALKEFENKPKAKGYKSIESQIEQYEGLDRAKDMLDKAKALAASVSRQSSESKKKLQIQRAIQRANGIANDPLEQERIKKLAKEMAKKRQKASEEIRKKAMDAISKIKEKRDGMEREKAKQQRKKFPTREETEKMRLANERRYLKAKMEELDKIKEKKIKLDAVSRYKCTVGAKDEKVLKSRPVSEITQEIERYEKEKREKALEAHQKMKVRQSEHLKELESRRRKQEKERKKERNRKKTLLKSVKKEVMRDVRSYLKEEEMKKDFKRVYGETNDSLLWFDPVPKTTPRVPRRPSTNQNNARNQQTIPYEEQLEKKIDGFKDKRDSLNGHAWNSRIANVLVDESEKGDPYNGLSRLIFKEKNWQKSIRRFTMKGIERRQKLNESANAKRSNAWWTRSNLGVAPPTPSNKSACGSSTQ